MPDRPIVVATRGSALALAQTHFIVGRCRTLCPALTFEIRIVKTTGDKLQKASMARPDASLPKGLFTKELEEHLLAGTADFAVHSLKDLPTDLPAGLALGAVTEREDVRDVLVYRAASASGAGSTQGAPPPLPPPRRYAPGASLADFPAGAVIATSSTRRAAQVLAQRPDLRTVEIRGNVGTRLRKIATLPELDATLLAHAGLRRLGFRIQADGTLLGPAAAEHADPADATPAGLSTTLLAPESMLPCVGQAAIGIEIRGDDARMRGLCERLNHLPTWQCVTAERAFLHAMGGGCQSPVAAYAERLGADLRLRAVSFREPTVRRTEARAGADQAQTLGERVAATLLGTTPPAR